MESHTRTHTSDPSTETPLIRAGFVMSDRNWTPLFAANWILYWIYLIPSLQQGKQHWRGEESLDDNFDNRLINARSNSHQKNDRRFQNPRHKRDFKHRSFHDGEFDSRNTSFEQARDFNFTSRRGFRFDNEKRGKKSNAQFLKRYTFWTVNIYLNDLLTILFAPLTKFRF